MTIGLVSPKVPRAPRWKRWKPPLPLYFLTPTAYYLGLPETFHSPGALMWSELPLEIWGEILGYLEYPGQDFKTLCTTSHFLCSLVQPILFSQIQLRYSEESIIRMMALESMFSQNPERRDWIKALYIIAQGEYIMTPASRRLARGHKPNFEPAVGKFLAQVTNLNSVLISGIRMTTDVFTTLLRLPGLRSLTYYNTNLEGEYGVPGTAVPEEDRLPAPTFDPSTDETSTGKVCDAVVSGSLECLVMCDARSPTNHFEFLLNRNATLARLTKFTTIGPRAADFSLLINFLRLCLNLIDLELRPAIGSRYHVDAFQVEASVIPKLTRFAGVVDLATKICNGRRIRSLKLCHDSKSRETQQTFLSFLLGLSRGISGDKGPTLKELQVEYPSCCEDELDTLASLFPRLSYISIMLVTRGERGRFGDLFQAFLHRMKYLERIDFTRSNLIRKDWKKILPSLRSHSRSIRLSLPIIFEDLGSKSRQSGDPRVIWEKVSSGKMKPFILIQPLGE